MLDRLFLASLAVALVGIIVGQAYRYGRVEGELAALKAQRATAIPQTRAALTGRPDEPVTTAQTPAPVSRVDETADRIARSNAALLERLYVEQAAARARRAQEAAEAAVARLSQELAAASSSISSMDRDLRVRDGRERQRREPSRPDRSYRGPTHEFDERPRVLHVNLCPPGQKLIAATCLPADSIILGQAPIPVRIVGPGRPLVRPPKFESPRRNRPARIMERSDPPASETPVPAPWTYRTAGVPVPQLGPAPPPRRAGVPSNGLPIP